VVVRPSQGPEGYVRLWHLDLGTDPVPFSAGSPSKGVIGALSEGAKK